MKRSLLSLAALAMLGLSMQAFAIDKPAAADGKMPTRTLPTPLPTAVVKPVLNTPPPPPPPPPPAPVTKLVSAKFLAAEVKVGESVAMKFDGINLGAGKICGGTVTWGDGTKFDNMLADNGQWSTINKTFSQAGTFTAVVLPKSYAGNPCVSDAPISVSIKVNPPTPLPPSMMTKLVVTPMVNPKARLISTKWVGTAPNSACSYILNFGDGTSKKTGAGAIQPGSDEQHTYASGTYSVIITPSNADYDSCTLGPDAGPKTFTVE
jgi:hypothetical protein